jgi:hypothetical protein
MSVVESKQGYDALPVPDEAAAHGGVEVLRVAVSDDELFILARPALKDLAEWGEILGEVTRRLGLLYAMGDTGFAEHDVIIAIEKAYAAEMGANSVAAEMVANSVGLEARRAPAKPKKAVARKAPRKTAKKTRNNTTKRKVTKPKKR